MRERDKGKRLLFIPARSGHSVKEFLGLLLHVVQLAKQREKHLLQTRYGCRDVTEERRLLRALRWQVHHPYVSSLFP